MLAAGLNLGGFLAGVDSARLSILTGGSGIAMVRCLLAALHYVGRCYGAKIMILLRWLHPKLSNIQ